MVYGILIFLLIGVTLEVAGKSMGMARITLGSVINSISGSIDQMVYSTWKGINYIRSKAKTISNPQSVDQANVRARVSECAKHWTDVLTDQQRANWETYASSIVIPSSGPGDIYKPAKGPFSGFTAFMRNNILMFTSGQMGMASFLAAAPIGITGPDKPNSVTGAGGALNVTVGWVAGATPGFAVLTWLRSRDRTYHPQIIAITAVAASPSVSTEANGAMGVAIPFASVRSQVDVQVVAIDAYGQPSAGSEIVRGIPVTGI